MVFQMSSKCWEKRPFSKTIHTTAKNSKFVVYLYSSTKTIHADFIAIHSNCVCFTTFYVRLFHNEHVQSRAPIFIQTNRKKKIYVCALWPSYLRTQRLSVYCVTKIIVFYVWVCVYFCTLRFRFLWSRTCTLVYCETNTYKKVCVCQNIELENLFVCAVYHKAAIFKDFEPSKKSEHP